jgi:hypothetical protein
MKASTKLILLGLGATGAAGGAVLAVRYFRARNFERNLDTLLTDLDAELEEPVIVSDEVIVVTEAGPYEADMEVVPQEGIEPDDSHAQK